MWCKVGQFITVQFIRNSNFIHNCLEVVIAEVGVVSLVIDYYVML